MDAKSHWEKIYKTKRRTPSAGTCHIWKRPSPLSREAVRVFLPQSLMSAVANPRWSTTLSNVDIRTSPYSIFLRLRSTSRNNALEKLPTRFIGLWPTSSPRN